MKLEQLAGVGPASLARLQKLGLHSVEDLLLHLPLRYEDRTRIVPVAELEDGVAARFHVTVQQARQVPGRRPSLLIEVADASEVLAIRLFHFRHSQLKQYAPGSQWLCWGDVRSGRFGRECAHPLMEACGADQIASRVGSNLTPIYPSTAGMTQQRWQKLMQQALAVMPRLLPELLATPADMTLAQALRIVHTPVVGDDEGLAAAYARLALEELLAQRLAILQGRERLAQERAAVCPLVPAEIDRFRSGLPFTLTAAQSEVAAEIATDLAKDLAMLRLVQGDVGCGKTVVAALAAVQVCASGRQVALMAPTEILARQHAQTLSQWLAPFGWSVGLLLGGLAVTKKKLLFKNLQSGELRVLVGTHALFSEGLVFDRLGLVIVDEQHRFGVGQRLALRDQGRDEDGVPHQLVLTATPIPRTLAQTLYADLDVSRINELPPGRSPVKTVAMPQTRRGVIIERLGVVCAEGQRAYWVCPALSESEHATAAEDIAELLRESLPQLPIALLHGQMKSVDKLDVMQRFRAGDIRVLVATTVVEVGVDVPEATIMIIDEAERLGLAQLHQLRGRVGRGAAASSCVLLYKSPLSETARARLDALCEIHDGFELAEKDLELRGPGELLGTAQSGEQRLRFADRLLDAALLEQVMRQADEMQANAPQLVAPLVRRWMGAQIEYAQV